MYRALLLLYIVTVLFYAAAASTHGLNYDNILEDFPLVVATGTQDAELMEDLASFVSDVGVRRGRGGRGGRGGARRYHDYILREERVYKDKVMDLMKQVLYAAQEHMGELAPVLDKYRGDPGFRMKFIFNKLQQYTVDMRRIYTLAVKGGVGVKVSDHLRLYQHLARKHVDVIYVVDHVIAAHDDYMETLLELQRREKAMQQDDRRDHEPPGDQVPRPSPDMDRGKGEMPPDEVAPADMPRDDEVAPGSIPS